MWNFQNFLATFVNGWSPVPEIKLGRSLNLNSNIGNSWVAELDATSNTCIIQNINLKQGRHLLRFNWAARANTALSTNGILVIVNRQLLKNIVPTDYALNTENLEFFINTNGGQTEFAFCGAGTSDGIGSLIDNIELTFFDESNFRINVY